MTVKSLLKFVEIQSLVASLLPLILANLYSLNSYHQFNWLLALAFATVAFALQMGVNVWNNLQDFKHAQSDDWKNGVNNIIGSAGITEGQAYLVLSILVFFAGSVGLWLVSQTGWPLLIMGVIGFVVAYWYAGTPWPLSRTPFGELASGLTMGYLIFLAGVYVNVAPSFSLSMALKAMLASAVAWFAIADIMLANNIGDYEEDLAEGRHTLPSYLGKARAVKLFGWIYVMGYGLLIIAVLLRVLPWPALIALLSIPIVYKNTGHFQADPAKGHNFIQAIRNALVISIFLALGLGLALCL